MKDKQSPTYRIASINNPKIPERSVLYNIKPIGIGTPLTESLSSYITRLAKAHAVYVKDILQPKLAPEFIRGYFLNDHGTRTPSWSRNSRAINGIHSWARDCVKGFERLTGRSDIHLLTMLPWASVIPTRGLQKKMKSWCPKCYEEWINSDHPIYDPLLWSIQFVDICAEHHVVLENACPHCEKEIPYLSSRSYPGHCSHCGRPLFEANHKPREIMSIRSPEIEWQFWMIDQIGKMIAFAPNLTQPPDPDHIFQLYRINTDRHFDGNVTEMSRLLQVTWIAVKSWIVGKHLPKFENLLRSCYCFRTTPLQVITGEKLTAGSTEIRLPLWVKYHKREKPPRKLNKEWILTELEKEISTQYLFPPSMADVSRSLELDQSHLMRLYPEECSQISKRYRKFCTRSKKNRASRLCKQVREIVRSLHEAGLYPGHDLVGSMLPSPWILRTPEINAAWKEALASLGYGEFDYKT